MKQDVVEGNKLIAVVYKIENLVNGKIYIGSSSVFIKRKKRHFEQLRSGVHHCKPLQRAFLKYGEQAFNITVIETFKYNTVADILLVEQRYLDTLLPEYNVCKVAGSQLGAKRDDIFRKGCSDRTKGKPAWNKGKKTGPVSEEKKQKMSSSHIGHKHSQKTKDKMASAKKGKLFGTQHKIKLSKAKIKHGKYSIWQSSYC